MEKNIFLLPVIKSGSSKLLYNKERKSFCFQNEPGSMYINDGKVSGADFWGIEKASNNGFLPHHIYITSIKVSISENDYIITQDGRLVQVSYLLSEEVSNGIKVVLTDDPKLIEDGVQAIEDDFLQWFVKNSSCEFVQVQDSKIVKRYICNDSNNAEIFLQKDNHFLQSTFHKLKVTINKKSIIIPQEEPKFEDSIPYSINLMSMSNSLFGKSELKQEETLEEAAKKYKDLKLPDDLYDAFITGAKWQKERSYSEEEVLELLSKRNFDLKFKKDNRSAKEWFEQFKKK